jgi:RNA polymerase sigma factor (sigma-70 family)
MTATTDWGAPQYREALLDRAGKLRIDPRVGVKFEADDLVNETLARAVKADRGDHPFRGTTEGERFKYLFTTQSHVLADWHDAYLDAGKRSVKREQDVRAFNQALTESMDQGMAGVAADDTSVSERAARKEEQEKERAWLDNAINLLPDRERDAMVRRFRQDQTLAQIAEAMGTTEDAVSGLLVRATRRLKGMADGQATGDAGPA